MFMYMIYILELLITEIYPGRMVMSQKFLGVFCNRQKLKYSTSRDQESPRKDDLEVYLIEDSPSPVDDSVSFKLRNKTFKFHSIPQLNIPDDPKYFKPNGFGPIYIGSLDGVTTRVRKLTVKDISTFQLREVPEEIKKWKKLKVRSIETYIAEYHETDSLYLVSEAHENLTSLQQLVQGQTNFKLTLMQKKSLIMSIIKAVLQLETRGDQFSHGHLCPSNILFDKNTQQVIIQDFGFHTLKSYCSMLTNYSNKDHYTSPENLKLKGKVIKKPTHKADVYSIGMIIFELITDKVVLSGMSTPELTKSIIEERTRPKIPADLHPEIASLVKLCWVEDPNSRPTYTEMLERISKINFD